MATTPAGPLSPYIPASAPRSADVVLYLDLDGVLHHEAVLWQPRYGIYMSPYKATDHALFKWLPILEEELAPHPSVALVLSSTWCIRPGYAKTLQRLPEQLRARFIGGTYHRRPGDGRTVGRTDTLSLVQEDGKFYAPGTSPSEVLAAFEGAMTWSHNWLRTASANWPNSGAISAPLRRPFFRAS